MPGDNSEVVRIDLVRRIEEQAVEIHALKQSVEMYRSDVQRLRDALMTRDVEVYKQLARQAVNCGPFDGCVLAKQFLKRTGNKDTGAI